MWNWVYICTHNSYKLKGNSESCLRCCATHKTAGESAFVYTHTHTDIISFSVGYCCHRQCFLLLHLYSLETRNGWKMITGESAVCVILSFHCSFPLFSCFSHITFSQLSPSSCLFPVWPSHHSNSQEPKQQTMTMHFVLTRCHLCSFFSCALTALWCRSTLCFKGAACFSTRGQGNMVDEAAAVD